MFLKNIKYFKIIFGIYYNIFLFTKLYYFLFIIFKKICIFYHSNINIMVTKVKKKKTGYNN